MKRRYPRDPDPCERTLHVSIHSGRCPVCRRDGDEWYRMVCHDPSCGYFETCCSICASPLAEKALAQRWPF